MTIVCINHAARSDMRLTPLTPDGDVRAIPKRYANSRSVCLGEAESTAMVQSIMS
jgi:hypothetical protein